MNADMICVYTMAGILLIEVVLAWLGGDRAIRRGGKGEGGR